MMFTNLLQSGKGKGYPVDERAAVSRFSVRFRLLSGCLVLTMIFGGVWPGVSLAKSPDSTLSFLPVPGTVLKSGESYQPAILRGITLHPDDPLTFDFIVNTGEQPLESEHLREQSAKIIKYFLATLTVPEEDMWVNLSPYEANRIIPESFGLTEMGRDLLAQDYLLKQLSASLMDPDGEIGAKIWNEINKHVGATHWVAPTSRDIFNKIWIVPEKAVVYEHGTSAFVVDAYLRVMTEQDYLATRRHSARPGTTLPNLWRAGEGQRPEESKDQILRFAQDDNSEAIRDVLIPAIEREVNVGKTFANLRQIYHSMILATWFKNHIGNLYASPLHGVYINQNKIQGVAHQDEQINRKIYNQYVESFKQGVHDLIREEYDARTQKIVPRKYFTGGVSAVITPAQRVIAEGSLDDGSLAKLESGHNEIVRSRMSGIDPEGQSFELMVQAPDDAMLHFGDDDPELFIGKQFNFAVKPEFKGTEPERRAAVVDQVTELLRIEELPLRGVDVTPFNEGMKALQFDLSAYDLDFRELRVFESVGQRGTQPMFVVHLPEKDLTYIMEADKADGKRKVLRSMMKILYGNEVDMTSTAESKPEPDMYWKESGNRYLYGYSRFIHPVVTDVVKRVIDEMVVDKADIRVMDIFGGDGRFLERLVDSTGHLYQQTTFKFTLQDRNSERVAEANRKFRKRSNVGVLPAADISALERLRDIDGEQLDIVTSIGGINNQVISRESAFQVAEKVFDGLTEGGFFIVSGLSKVHLSADNFEDIGFEVLNQTIPENILLRRAPTELYILRKPSSDEAMAADRERRETPYDIHDPATTGVTELSRLERDNIKKRIVEILKEAPEPFPKVTVENLERIFANRRNAGYSYIFRDVNQKLRGFIVAFENKRIGPETVVISKLWVDPKYRRQGIASQLLKRVAMAAEVKERKKILLGTVRSAEKAMDLYKGLGFRELLEEGVSVSPVVEDDVYFLASVGLILERLELTPDERKAKDPKDSERYFEEDPDVVARILSILLDDDAAMLAPFDNQGELQAARQPGMVKAFGGSHRREGWPTVRLYDAYSLKLSARAKEWIMESDAMATGRAKLFTREEILSGQVLERMIDGKLEKIRIGGHAPSIIEGFTELPSVQQQEVYDRFTADPTFVYKDGVIPSVREYVRIAFAGLNRIKSNGKYLLLQYPTRDADGTLRYVPVGGGYELAEGGKEYYEALGVRKIEGKDMRMIIPVESVDRFMNDFSRGVKTVRDPFVEIRQEMVDEYGLFTPEQYAELTENKEESDDEDGAMNFAGDDPGVGGIDFNPGYLNWQRDNDYSPMDHIQFPDVNLEGVTLDGLLPVIIDMQPLTNLPLLLGISNDAPELPNPEQTNPMTTDEMVAYRNETDVLSEK